MAFARGDGRETVGPQRPRIEPGDRVADHRHVGVVELDVVGGEFSHSLTTADSVEDFHELADDRFVYGTPDQIIEQIESMQDRFDLNQLALRFHHSGMPKELVEEQIRLFGERVVPAFD